MSICYITAQCHAEVTTLFNGSLTWTDALPSDLVPSLERCSVYTENGNSYNATYYVDNFLKMSVFQNLPYLV